MLLRGAAVRGKVTDPKSSGRLNAPGELTLRLTSVAGHRVSTSPMRSRARATLRVTSRRLAEALPAEQ